MGRLIEHKQQGSGKKKYDLFVGYTQGVAEPSRMIHKNKEDIYEYIEEGNTTTGFMSADDIVILVFDQK